MEIRHRITFGHKDNLDATIARLLGNGYRRTDLPGGGYLLHLDICESHQNWPRMAELAADHQAVDIYDTLFDEKEILAAEFIRLIPSFEHGYPQPTKQMAWRQQTYEYVCEQCGICYGQKAGFRFASEPKLGRNSFLSLYWTYAVFCVAEVRDRLSVAGIQGLEIWPAVLDRTNNRLKTVSQIYIPNVADPGLAAGDKLSPQECPNCGHTKYAVHRRGLIRFSRESLHGDLDFQLTNEWFGSGGKAAFREIIISGRIARLILHQKWLGVTLKPIQLV